MRIGIDVGGTNTDAVLMDGDRVLAAVKAPTTEDVTSGIVAALDGLQEQHPFPPADVRAVMIGTTHFINALVQARDLAPTAALRLGLPATASLPPMIDWPHRLVDAIEGRAYLAHGGHEFDGRPISPLESSLTEAAAVLGVHRNTVAARVARAQELLGVELADPDERLALHLACRSVLFHA